MQHHAGRPVQKPQERRLRSQSQGLNGVYTGAKTAGTSPVERRLLELRAPDSAINYSLRVEFSGGRAA
eukprot:5715512-Pyramimonas_sp.AAC.1